MVTNLKKSHKIKNLIITLVILMPALVLTCLYPKMEEAMLLKKNQWETEWQAQMEAQKPETPEEEIPAEELEAKETAEEITETDSVNGTTQVELPREPEEMWYLMDNFVNYAVETSYYQYAKLLQTAEGEEVFTDVLEYYNWVGDYYEFTSVTPYYVSYGTEEEGLCTANNAAEFGFSTEDLVDFGPGALSDMRRTQLIDEGVLGCLVLQYDSYGKLYDVRIRSLADNLNYDSLIYERAKNSIEQYKTNADYYKYDGYEGYEVSRAYEVCPKDFYGVYLIHKDNEMFVSWSDMTEEGMIGHVYMPYYQPHDYYFAIGAYWIVAALVVFVALAALILPFFKGLETGWEKLFSWPFEIMCCVGTGAVLLGCGMCILMSTTTRTELTEMIVEQGFRFELLGYAFTVEQCYWMLILVNFLGWAAVFFLEYMTVAHARQFLVRPLYYMKNRLLGIVFIRWIWRQCKRLGRYVADIDIHENLHKSILKIVLANAVVVGLLCCLWFAGLFGVIVYSVLLYILLRKYGSNLQRQYQSILNATEQMAEGNLHMTLEEDLGIFEPLGQELEGVQQGFAKAVAEEAKSQNMKSELITNVSHDLKTPLTAIITYVDLLKKSEITEEERKSYIETLDLKSQRLKVLIEDLFEVSKANSGNVTMNFMDVDIVKLLKEVRVEMSDKIEQSNLDFRWNLPEEKVVLNLDGQRTYRIFENLLNNAMKYAMPYTRVYVDVVNEETGVTITFKNMSAQELDFDAQRLTDRFVRGDRSRNSEGSGLGLAIAKSFTELQNGQFTVKVDGDLFKVTITFLKS